MQINIGIEERKRQEVAAGLAHLLADSYTLYLKTHNYHWNVKGIHFSALHAMFEQQYTELALAVDVIAERIRSLGIVAPGSFAEFLKLATVKDEPGVPAAKQMIQNLVVANETVAATARKIFPLAEDAKDEATVDVLTQRIQQHEKTAWMLRTLLED